MFRMVQRAGTALRADPGNQHRAASKCDGPPTSPRMPGAAGLATVLAVAALVMLAPVARAADAQGNFAVRGAGGAPCERVVGIVDASGPQMAAIVSWTDGALTMANRMEAGVFDMVPFSQPSSLLTALAVNVCRQNPRLVYAAAVSQVLEALRPLRVRTSAEPEVITHEGNSVALRRETVTLIQERLRERGHLRGSATGGWGPQSREAMRLFQVSQNLPPTRIPDPTSVLRLMLTR
jgi:hypothetical protein